MKRFALWLALLATLLLSSASYASMPIPPAPTGDDYIVDNADILTDEQETTLNKRLTEYEARTST